MKLLLSWLLNALALLAVAYFVPDIHLSGLEAALIAAVVIGFVNCLIKPILVILTLPVTILTLGLFILVINGVLFWAVARYLPGFDVRTLTAGIIGALAYSVLSWLLSALLIDKDK
jgi:putative membrane protein